MDLNNLKAIYDKQNNEALAKERHLENQSAMLQLQETVVQSFKSLTDYLDTKVDKTEVLNPVEEVSTPDVQNVVDAIQVLARMMVENKLDISPIENGINELVGRIDQLKESVAGLPTEFPEVEIPEQKEEVKVTNLSDIDFTTLEKAIKDIKMVAEAPQVNVDAPDLSPIKDSLSTVVKAIEDIKFPDIPKTDLSQVEKKLDKSNKLLKEIVEKPVSGGGGGGRATPYQDSAGMPAFVELINGAMPTTEAKASSGSTATASVTNANTLVLAANANRKGATIYNESGATAYVKLGATASTTSYTIQIIIGAYYEVPYGYTGIIDGITASGTAVLRVGEFT